MKFKNMYKRVLLVLPNIRIKKRGADFHRFLCYIKAYKDNDYDVEVLAFCKDALFFADTHQFDMGVKWIIFPCILPIAKNIVMSKILEWYTNFVVAIFSWVGSYDVIQMELWGAMGLFRKRKGIKYVVDVHGDLPHEVSESRSEGKWYVNYCIYQQKEFLKKADVCVVVNDLQISQFWKNTQLLPRDSCVISCGADNDGFYNARVAGFNKCNLADRLVLGYSGGVSKWQNVEAMLDLVIKLHDLDERVYLLFYTGGDLGSYQAKFDELGAENYHVARLDPSEVASHLKLMDAGMVLRSNLVLNKVCSPTKICEYMAAGLPLVCTKFSGDYARCVIHGENGFVGEELEFTEKEIFELLAWLDKIHNNRDYYSRICMNSVRERSFNNEFKKLDMLLRTD